MNRPTRQDALTAILLVSLGVIRAIQSGDTVLVEVGSGNYEFVYDAPALAARLRGGGSR